MWILNPLLWDFVNFGFRIESMQFCFFLSNESFGFLLDSCLLVQCSCSCSFGHCCFF